MGWSFSPSYQKDDKKRYIKDNLGGWENNGTKVVVLKQTTKGNVVWSVEERTDGKGISRTILCDLLEFRKADGWGHKSLDEGMSPYYYSCPVSFFKLAPVPYNEYARKWREKVIEETKEKKRKKQEKDNLPALLLESKKQGKSVIAHLEGCKIPTVAITSIKPFLGYSDGVSYRLNMGIIQRIEVI